MEIVSIYYYIATEKRGYKCKLSVTFYTRGTDPRLCLMVSMVFDLSVTFYTRGTHPRLCLMVSMVFD